MKFVSIASNSLVNRYAHLLFSREKQDAVKKHDFNIFKGTREYITEPSEVSINSYFDNDKLCQSGALICTNLFVANIK